MSDNQNKTQDSQIILLVLILKYFQKNYFIGHQRENCQFVHRMDTGL